MEDVREFVVRGQDGWTEEQQKYLQLGKQEEPGNDYERDDPATSKLNEKDATDVVETRGGDSVDGDGVGDDHPHASSAQKDSRRK